ncbi:dipeptidase [Gammaproteobacteria bacterium]|uniref:Peptidase M19 n=1 Tax=OM182 bacterium MED-G28 TaxID=1986256 RepID=A0A2A5WBA3_9GAMM|nr:dipeptidase [Gammaproteobacteria bacterium]PDH33436.1 MAG: peptidase M19 [OM182 bacterium MED-G28]
MKHYLNQQLLIISILFFFLMACSDSSNLTPAPETDAELIARARGIHERVITLDTHADINTTNFTATRNYTQDLDTQVNLPKMEAGGLDVAWFIVYTGQGTLDNEGYDAAYANAIDKFDAIHRLAEEIAPDQIEIAYSSADVQRIHATGKKVAMIGIENAYSVGLDLSRIEEFYQRGGRYMSLAHNGHSQFSDSHTGEADNDYMHDGLSDIGREAIAEMNRLGIMIDISHPSKDSIMQTIELSRAPVIASHSSARAVTNHTRNLDDEMLLAVQENGGVVQTTAFSSYVSEARRAFLAEGRNRLEADIAESLGFEILTSSAVERLSASDRASYDEAYAELNSQLSPRLRTEVNAQAPEATVSDFIDHIDYIVALIGLEHVGISSDFDGGGGIEGWNDASESFNVTLELVRRGYTEEQIDQLWSGNLLRVLDEVQNFATAIQAEE